MIQYLKKFNTLPTEIKTKMSAPAKMKLIDSLEQKYGLDLAAFVMRVVISDIAYNKQTAALMREFQIPQDRAKQIVRELKTKVFSDVADYLQAQNSPKFLPKPQIKSFPKKISIDHLIAAHNEKISQTKPADISKSNKMSLEASEDKQEISEFAKIVNEVKKDLPIDKKLEISIDHIIKEIKLSFSSEVLSKRFKQSLSFYLKGAKSRINTREFFLKEVSKGGLNFEPILADRVLKIADEQKIKNQEAKKVDIKSRPDGTTFVFNDQAIKQEKLNQVSANNADYDLSKAIAERQALGAKQPETSNQRQESGDKRHPSLVSDRSGQDSGSTLQASRDDVSEQDQVRSVVDRLQSAQRQESSDKSPATRVQQNTFTKNSVLGQGVKTEPISGSPKKHRISAADKNKIHDIKPISRAMNPIDELRYMDLMTFRRMGASTRQIVDKITEKIELISNEGISKRLEAISAWKNSPVNNIYLQMGKQSIGQGFSIEEVIALREKEGKDVLTMDEFEAILDLNNKLRF